MYYSSDVNSVLHGTVYCTEQCIARNSVVQGGRVGSTPVVMPMAVRPLYRSSHPTVVFIGVHTRLHYAEYIVTVRYMPHVHRQLRIQSPGLNGPISLRASGTQRTVVLVRLLGARSFSPGSQSPSGLVKGKCWIDPGTLDPRLPGLQGPEMDCI